MNNIPDTSITNKIFSKINADYVFHSFQKETAKFEIAFSSETFKLKSKHR